jgi:hypothetical protein
MAGMTDGRGFGNNRPLKRSPAFLLKGGLKNKPGTLLLYPDRIVHVASRGIWAGAAFGALGALLGQVLASRRAERHADAGGPNVLQIPLSTLSGVHRGKQGINRDILEITTADGQRYQLGTKYTKWGPEIRRLVQAQGREPVEVDGGFVLA